MEKIDRYYKNFKKHEHEIFDIIFNLEFTISEEGKLIPPKDLNAAKDYISFLITQEKTEDARRTDNI